MLKLPCEHKWLQPTRSNLFWHIDNVSRVFFLLTIFTWTNSWMPPALWDEIPLKDSTKDLYINVETLENFIHIMLHFVATLFKTVLFCWFHQLMISYWWHSKVFISNCVQVFYEKYMSFTCQNKFCHLDWNHLWSDCTEYVMHDFPFTRTTPNLLTFVVWRHWDESNVVFYRFNLLFCNVQFIFRESRDTLGHNSLWFFNWLIWKNM